jgi:ferredoxin
MRLRLDAALCCGHGRCYALCPELFEEDAAGRAILVTPDVSSQLETRARAAVDNCPESAIAIEP